MARRILIWRRQRFWRRAWTASRGLQAGDGYDENLFLLSPAEAQSRGIELVPANLGQALDELERDEVLCQSLGIEYSKMYLETKRAEWDEYSAMTSKNVTPWELQKYLVL